MAAVDVSPTSKAKLNHPNPDGRGTFEALEAQLELLRVATGVAWTNVVEAFTRRQSLDDPEVEQAVSTWKNSRALQVATEQKLMQMMADGTKTAPPDPS